MAGTKIPPVELTASTTIEKSAVAMAWLFTIGSAKIASICFCRYVSSFVTLPRSSTSAKLNAFCSAMVNTILPSSPVINSPFSFNNLSAFHCFGLWLAVIMIPPCAFSNGTAISTVGVVDSPRFTTSIPNPTSVEETKSEIISPEILASRPITTFNFSRF